MGRSGILRIIRFPLRGVVGGVKHYLRRSIPKNQCYIITVYSNRSALVLILPEERLRGQRNLSVHAVNRFLSISSASICRVLVRCCASSHRRASPSASASAHRSNVPRDVSQISLRLHDLPGYRPLRQGGFVRHALRVMPFPAVRSVRRSAVCCCLGLRAARPAPMRHIRCSRTLPRPAVTYPGSIVPGDAYNAHPRPRRRGPFSVYGDDVHLLHLTPNQGMVVLDGTQGFS